ncbi:MAG: DNA-3-methyladenine glycosylase 2 family protein [Gemmatimonadetes bacterium]|nr:DNA-3-methyladenine glycosylase 2 family protein [Gemmatimonadota bacterium]
MVGTAPTPPRLTADTLAAGTRALARREPAFARIVAQHGPPPLWVRAPGFATLVRLILEQQVSLVSARAVWLRLRTAAGAVSARRVYDLGEQRLREVGCTRQKASYVHGLAADIVTRRLSLARLATMPDDAARATLLSIRGIGPWTADVYRLVALRALDVWPPGDVALADAAHRVFDWPARPAQDALTAHAEQWAPWRSVAARLLWHHYLSVRAAR